ncbi:neutral zinc metallopeptidase [Halomonas halocynthiae]|uniref:KPN_02809 family neutral zinc metallopeptidase n=1 Tax=Halomonas halocynthiae TaxID=176290 RepID=UPI00041507C3|nr:neutral zinc metallopeptidase [Halomonas halocynthiae]
MRWRGRRQSRNIDDRRGQPTGFSSASSRGGSRTLLRLLPMLLRSKGGRAILVVGGLAVAGAKLAGIDLLPMLMGGGSLSTASHPSQAMSQEQEELANFVGVVLADTEETWQQVFQRNGATYQEPTLVLFTGQVSSACGRASASVGPFYCPSDQQVYLDLSFFEELGHRHGAPGDFAQAYVIAHEVGHHVQTLMGISNQVRQEQANASQQVANDLSVRQELQADCFAGLWGYYANNHSNMLDPGDLEEALQAASAIGDDHLQRQAGRAVMPDSFTHGSSAQRVRWFKRGFESGDLQSCNTFSANRL